MIGIYKITSPSGKVYIGQSWNIQRRFKDYNNSYKKCTGEKLLNSIIKYGIKNHKFSVIHELPADIEQSVLDSYEQLYMDLYSECGIELLNLREGGSHGKTSCRYKKEEIGLKNKGLTRSKESKLKNKLSHLGKTFKLTELQKLNNSKVKYKPIIQYSLNNDYIKEWPSIKEVSILLNINKTSISAVGTNKKYSKSAGGFIWKFK